MNKSEKPRQPKRAQVSNGSNGPSSTGPLAGRHDQAVNIQDVLDQGFHHHNAGDLATAERHYQRVLQAEPNHPIALHLLGVIAHQVGKNQIAVDLIGQALRIKPDYTEAYSNRAIALQELKHFDAALASYDKAIALNPDFAEAHCNRGNALQALNQSAAAIASYDQALALKPDYAEAYLGRGISLERSKKREAAVASYDQAIALNPGYAEAYSNRGLSLAGLKQHAAAVTSYDQAITLKPEYAVAYFNRGISLERLLDLDAAIASYDQAIALKPDDAHAHTNRGIALRGLKRLDAALASYDQALALQPDHAEARYNKSIALLLCGQLDEAWPLYEWRWKTEAIGHHNRIFSQPQWQGGEPLHGKTLLLHSEQGLGDTLQFCRYAKMFAGTGTRVIMEVPALLVDLLHGLEGVNGFVIKGRPLPAFDVHSPLLSLPGAFKTRITTIPNSVPYLLKDVKKSAQWAHRLGPHKNLRVGLIWRGSPENKEDRVRSMDPDFFKPLFDLQGITFYNLQFGGAEETRDVFGTAVVELMPEAAAFCETAAAIDNLDLLISIDSSSAHLAGALGTPVWTLLPYVADWRWMLERDDSPWYPTMRLFRQDSAGDWRGVIDRVRLALATRANEFRVAKTTGL